MKGQDIIILLKLALLQHPGAAEPRSANVRADSFSVRGLESALGISKSEVSASIRRSADAGLLVKDRRSGIPNANTRALLKFIVHGLKYVFPVKPGPLVRGMPTAAAAPALKQALKSADQPIHVWPDAEGEEFGQSLKPLFKSVPHAARRDPKLYDLLALVDAIRLGNPRESKVARQLLEKRLIPS